MQMAQLDHIAQNFGPSAAFMVGCLRNRFSGSNVAEETFSAMASIAHPDELTSGISVHQLPPLDVLHPAIIAQLPESWVSSYRVLHQRMAARALSSVAEIRFLSDSLKRAGFDVRFWKGPVLSLLLHGDLTSRPTRDIDVLIRPSDLLPVRRLLMSLGYTDDQPLRENLIPIFWRTHREWVMHRTAENGLQYFVELQRAPAMSWSLSRNAATMAFSGLNMVELGGTGIPVPDPETHWLMLAAHHGYSEGWRQLRQVSDMAAFATLQAGVIDEERLFRLSGQFGLNRVMSLGLGLAHDIAGTRVPSTFSTWVKNEKPMIQRLTSRLLGHPLPKKSEESMDAIRLQWSLAENDQARWRLLSGHLRKWLSPGYFELSNIYFSTPFTFLYTPMKMARPLVKRFLKSPSTRR